MMSLIAILSGCESLSHDHIGNGPMHPSRGHPVKLLSFVFIDIHMHNDFMGPAIQCKWKIIVD
eukprot:15332074-Ditylum_brightwellii.AAC.1